MQGETLTTPSITVGNTECVYTGRDVQNIEWSDPSKEYYAGNISAGPASVTLTHNRYGEEFVTVGLGSSVMPFSAGIVEGDLPGNPGKMDFRNWAVGVSENVSAGAGLLGIGASRSVSSGVVAREIPVIVSPQAGWTVGYTWQTKSTFDTSPVYYCWNPNRLNSYSPAELERMRERLDAGEGLDMSQ